MKSKASILSILALVVVVLMVIGYVVVGADILPSNSMSRHGWIALGLGTGFSVVVGAALAAVLIISRRNGYDEAAHEIYRKFDDRGD